MHRPVYFWILIVAIAVMAPYVMYPAFLIKALCFALFACSFNLLIGYAGLLSFGHAAYFGMGAYVAAWAAKQWNFTPELAILGGTLVAAAMGLVFGWIAIRRHGIYFAMITLALAQMVYFFCLESPFTGGEDGIQNVPRGKLFGVLSLQSDLAMYALVLGVFCIGFFIIYRTIHSPYGHVLRAIKNNQQRSTSLGYDNDAHKLIAFVISAGLAGAAGSVKALAFGIATLIDAHFSMSGEVVLMTLLGGMGTLAGPVVGAFVFTLLESKLAPFGAWVLVAQGAVFIVCVMIFRRGIVGEIIARFPVSIFSNSPLKSTTVRRH
jgi:branched-chain amino acid transport system permease protein